MAPTKTFIVTGGNTGLGFECARALSEDSSVLVIIACRDGQKGEKAARLLLETKGNAKVLPLDLSMQASVRASVEEFRRGQFPPLVGIVCNAGLQNVGTPTKTEEGYETTFVVNHLGHYLLTRLLLPDLATNASITFVSSGTHDPQQKTGMPVPRYVTAEALAHDFEPGGNAGRRRYTTSKLCNVYCTYEYARRLASSSDSRLQSLRVNAFDPGLMPATELARTYSAPLRFASCLGTFCLRCRCSSATSIAPQHPADASRCLPPAVRDQRRANTSPMGTRLDPRSNPTTHKRRSTYGTRAQR